MACQNPPEPCPNDASRDSGPVMSACISDADCMAILTADDFAAGDEPTQAEVLDSGCGANAECCAIVTCRTALSCTSAQSEPPDCSAEQEACFAAPDCLAAMMSSMASCGAPPVSRLVNAPPSLPALTVRVSRGSDGLTERRVLHAV